MDEVIDWLTFTTTVGCTPLWGYGSPMQCEKIWGAAQQVKAEKLDG